MMLRTFYLLALISFTSVSSQPKNFDLYSYYIPGLVVNESEGIMVEMLTAINQQLPYNFQLKLLPTKRAQKQFKQNKILGYFPELEEHRAKSSCRSAEFMQKGVITFTRKNEPKVDHVSQLESMRVGAVAGYSYGNEIISNDNILINYVSSDEINIKKLLSGRVDVIIGDMHSTVAAIKSLELADQIEFDVNKPIVLMDVFFVFQNDFQGQIFCRDVSKILIEFKQQGLLYQWFGYQ